MTFPESPQILMSKLAELNSHLEIIGACVGVSMWRKAVGRFYQYFSDILNYSMRKDTPVCLAPWQQHGNGYGTFVSIIWNIVCYGDHVTNCLKADMRSYVVCRITLSSFFNDGDEIDYKLSIVYSWCKKDDFRISRHAVSTEHSLIHV